MCLSNEWSRWVIGACIWRGSNTGKVEALSRQPPLLHPITEPELQDRCKRRATRIAGTGGRQGMKVRDSVATDVQQWSSTWEQLDDPSWVMVDINRDEDIYSTEHFFLYLFRYLSLARL